MWSMSRILGVDPLLNVIVPPATTVASPSTLRVLSTTKSHCHTLVLG